MLAVARPKSAGSATPNRSFNNLSERLSAFADRRSISCTCHFLKPHMKSTKHYGKLPTCSHIEAPADHINMKMPHSCDKGAISGHFRNHGL